ncbi:hypothetical protein C8F04DRAFT_1187304 [Mycena alexandri]|uniref:Uncharacterized protein n=1 Tax=Mycena alexandri TaxID=1745969 RepID=A0AAD6SNS8_9AGAR|nr:hypothetical protein C8F04DRAFT_1187304 [Mycena alexandri]
MARGRRHQKWGGQYSIYPGCQQVVHIQVMNLSATAVSAVGVNVPVSPQHIEGKSSSYWWTQPFEAEIESSYRGSTTTTKMTQFVLVPKWKDPKLMVVVRSDDSGNGGLIPQRDSDFQKVGISSDR